MRKDKIIEFISIASSVTDSKGDTIKTKGYRKTYAREKSIRQSEFYQAAATGLQPDITFVVWTREYKGEQALRYNNKEYKIIRTYKANGEETELICQGLVNNVTA